MDRIGNLTYNGIKIGLTRTLGIAHVPVRTDDNTYMYTAITIDVVGLVSAAAVDASSGDEDGGSLGNVAGTLGVGTISDTMQAIRSRLLQERQQLVYDLGDAATPMIVAPVINPDGTTFPTDANNGPVPRSLTINRVDGIAAFHVTYQITCYLQDCPGVAGGAPSALISNRYAQAHTINEHFFTTITTSGQAMFRTDILEQAQQVADDYRQMLFPPVPLGFKRMAVRIAGTPARNALTYEVTDVERAFDLGDTGVNGSNSNITDCKAIYSVSSTGQGGAPVSVGTLHTVRAEVWGSKASTSWTLIKAAFNIASTKLPIFNPGRGFLTAISITTDLTGRYVALQASMLLTPTNANAIPGIDIGELQVDDSFAPQGGINPALPSRGGTAGTYQNEILAAAWSSACGGPQKPYEGAVAAADTSTDYSANTGPIVTVTTTPNLPTFTPKYSTAQLDHIFTDYKIDSAIVTETGMVQQSIAGRVGSSLGGSSGSAGPTSEFLTLAPPRQRMVVEWSAERVGAAPTAPAAVSSDSNRVLVDAGHVQVCEPTLLPDGVNRSFRISGRYVYGLAQNLAPTAVLPFPIPPSQTGYYGSVAMSALDFQVGIIDGVGSISQT